jgi:FHIPEP family
MSPLGRPKGEYRSAQHEGSPVSAEGRPVSTGAGLQAFIAARCGPHRACVPEAAADAAVAGPPVLSLFEIHTGMDADRAEGHDFLVVLALQVSSSAATQAAGRVLLRLVTRSAMRSAGRASAAGWVVNDIRVPAAGGLQSVSLLVYRLRRTPHLDRTVTAIENLLEPLEAAPDEAFPALERAALDWLEVLDSDTDAEVLIGGHALPLAAGTAASYVALMLPGPPAPADGLWLHEGRLLAGPERDSAQPLVASPYVLLRHGPQPTQQSVRDFIDEIRRRHQRAAAEPAAQAPGESFAEMVDRQLMHQRQQRTKAMFGHGTMYPVVTPVALEVAPDLVPTVQWTDGQPSRFKDLLDAMRASIESEFGVHMPGLRVRGNDGDLPAGAYIIMIDEVPLVMGTARADRLLCRAGRDRLPPHLDAGQAEATTWPAEPDTPACWVPPDWSDDLQQASLATCGAAEYMLAHLRAMLLRDLARFATLDEVERAVHASDGGPELLKSLQAAPGGVVKFAMLLRALLLEGLPVAPIAPLAQFSLFDPRALPMLELAAALRMLPVPRRALVNDRASWRRFELDGAFEAALRDGLQQAGEGAVLALSPELTQEMLAAVRQAIESKLPSAVIGAVDVVVVREASLRPFVRSLLRLEFPLIRMLSRQEVDGLTDLPPLAALIELT